MSNSLRFEYCNPYTSDFRRPSPIPVEANNRPKGLDDRVSAARWDRRYRKSVELAHDERRTETLAHVTTVTPVNPISSIDRSLAIEATQSQSTIPEALAENHENTQDPTRDPMDCCRSPFSAKHKGGAGYRRCPSTRHSSASFCTPNPGDSALLKASPQRRQNT